MKFVNREPELERLDALARSATGGLAVLFGRRRIGKTRLLVEWCHRHGGIYTVADQSAAEVQRRYLAEAVAIQFPGFADVDYRDWRTLFVRIANEARAAAWRGPLVFDELPNWVASSPELPSVLQHWIDHDARAANLVVAIAGSSQRMMQGLVLDRDAALFGRAKELFEVLPLAPNHVSKAVGLRSARAILDWLTAWGGVPRYWELAVDHVGDIALALDVLVLDPAGVLHREPDRLLLEELPSAVEVRPILDAIGSGAHRYSEIAGRMGIPATSLSRPLDRLIELGLITREIPFGEPPRTSKKSLYKISDPFTRLWFRVVAPHRAELVSGTRKSRLALLARHWDQLVAQSWEDVCRQRIGQLAHPQLGGPGDWKPASRWWRGAAEWDLVAEDVANRRLLLGECRLSSDLRAAGSAALSRPAPVLPARYRSHEQVRAIFVPAAEPARRTSSLLPVVTLQQLVGS